MPRFANAFRSSLEASVSSCGMRESSISMIVTSLPKRSKIEANSQPMIPPPRTTRRLGTSVWASRPVESTQRGELIPRIGGRTGYEPVATIALVNVRPVSLPSKTIERASSKRPVPSNAVTPLALKSDATPLVIWCTTAVFHSFAWSKSSVGSPVTTPSLGSISRAACSAVCRLHPGLRRDAADAKARPTELGLLLDADHARPELRCANRCRVAGRAGAENGDVELHGAIVSSGAGLPRLYSARRMVTLSAPSSCDARESVLLLVVRDQRLVVALDGEAHRPLTVGLRAFVERVQERVADAASTPARHDRDRELGRLLVDEPVARQLAPEQPIPRRADREAVLDRDQGRVADSSPALDVQRHRPRPLARLALAPVVGVVEHVAQEANVLAAAAADDHGGSLERPARRARQASPLERERG